MKKKTLLVGGIVVLLLAGAAFIGVRLLSGQGLSETSLPGPGFTLKGDGYGPTLRINRDDTEPAKELPQTPAEFSEIFDHREDNSLFVGTDNFTLNVRTDQSGKVVTSSNDDGTLVEIVVTSQTTIYEDVTMQQFNGPPPDGQKIQQVLEPGSLDDIAASSAITIWGKKTGDRFIANVLVYVRSVFIEK
jgi:hypothetical protein